MEKNQMKFPLPEELLPNVFQFLPINEKLNASLVCKTWLLRMSSIDILSNVCVQVPTEHIQNAVPFSRRFTNFVFKNVELMKKHLCFFKIYGDNIRKLKFVDCSIKSNLKKQCLKEKFCRNLHILEFDITHFNIFPELPDLKELVLFRNEYKGIGFTNADMIAFGKTMPKLEKLVLGQSLYKEDNLVGIVPLEDGEIFGDENLEDVLTLSSLYNFMEKRAKTLISLEFDAVNLLPIKACDLFYLQDFKMKELYIQGNRGHLNFISDICFYHRTTITALHLPNLKISDSEVEFICYLLPLLESLTLRGNCLLNCSIEEIFGLERLRYLDLGFCSNLRDDHFQMAFAYFKSDHLRSLYLNDISVEDVTLRRLLKRLPSLHYLNLSGCRNVSNRTVRFISEKLPFLQHLSLQGCPNITDEGILAIHNPAQSISNLKDLEELNLLMCSAITSTAIQQAIKFDGLRILHYGPVTIDLEEILMFKNPSLKRIISEIQDSYSCCVRW